MVPQLIECRLVKSTGEALDGRVVVVLGVGGVRGERLVEGGRTYILVQHDDVLVGDGIRALGMDERRGAGAPADRAREGHGRQRS